MKIILRIRSLNQLKQGLKNGIRGFLLLESEPFFEEAIEILSSYEEIFLVSIYQGTEKIKKTSLSYNLLLLTNPISQGMSEHEKETTLYHHWLKMSQLKEIITEEIGINNFYINDYLTLMRMISSSGFPLPWGNAIVEHVHTQHPNFIGALKTFGCRVLAKVSQELINSSLKYYEKENILYIITE